MEAFRALPRYEELVYVQAMEEISAMKGHVHDDVIFRDGSPDDSSDKT